MGTALEDTVSVLDDCRPKLNLLFCEAVVAGFGLADHADQGEHEWQLAGVAVLVG